jgi:hypothetical protein
VPNRIGLRIGFCVIGCLVVVVISVWIGRASGGGNVGKTVANAVSKNVAYQQPNAIPLEQMVTGKKTQVGKVDLSDGVIELRVMDTKMSIPREATRVEFTKIPKWIRGNEADFGLTIAGPGYKFFRYYKKKPWDEMKVSLKEADTGIVSRALISTGVGSKEAWKIVRDTQSRLLGLSSLDLLKKAMEITRSNLVSERRPDRAAELGLLLLARGSSLSPTGSARYFLRNSGEETVYLIQSMQGDPIDDNFVVYAFSKEGDVTWTGTWNVPKCSRLNESGSSILLRILREETEETEETGTVSDFEPSSSVSPTSSTHTPKSAPAM